ncbi:MAG TPA: polysaccharide deacetylase family protein [Candidatus Krumholzibacteria bacterium]|nr:polysaccharide deacetylase family protein [Candidatus Krumholzibacteria bacterium]
MSAVPVIMYHSIGRVLPDWAWSGLTTPAEVFEDHLRALARAGYRTATLAEFHDHVGGKAPLAGKRVVLTFDDGYVDNWSYAAPLLEKYGFTGTVLVTVEFVAPGASVRPTLREVWNESVPESALDVRGFMSWEEMRRAVASGVLEIQSHAMTHTWYPVGDTVVDFHHPGDAHYWLDWNAFPESKPAYLTTLGQSRVPYGVPVYAHEKSLKCRRYFPDPAEAEHMADWVRSHGGHEFFATPDWTARLHGVLAQFRAGRTSAGRTESDSERIARIKWEVAESKRVIAENTGREVSFLVWPGGGYDDVALKIARQHYVATTVSTVERWRHRNRAGENPGMIVRRGAPELMARGRSVYAPGAYLVDMLDEFRGSHWARRRRQARKLILLAAARGGLWPRRR